MPHWLQNSIEALTPTGYILAIIAVAWVFQWLSLLFLEGLHRKYQLPSEWLVGGRRFFRAVVSIATLLLILGVLGVSGSTLWTAFTGFAAVAAVAFFAAWSVLSNLFCAVMIFATRLFRINDHVELLETSDKPGLRGKVVDINLIFTTLQEGQLSEEVPPATLRVPNNLFFQRVLRHTAAVK